MRYRAIVTLIALFMLFGVSKAVESQQQKWYWAWRDSTQELLAYTADGQVNTLLKGFPVNQIWLGEGNMAIALILDDKLYSFYKLTSTEAIPIKSDFDTRRKNYDVRFFLSMLDTSHPIVSTTESDRLILIDLDNEQAHLLDHKLTAYTSVSLDHQVLWFLADPDKDDAHTLWNVWEHRLDTGEEHLLHKQEKPFPNAKSESLECKLNPVGDQQLCWLVTDLNPSARIDTWLINSDGTAVYRQVNQFSKAEDFIVDCVSNKSGNEWLCRSDASLAGKTRGFSIWVVNHDGTIRSVVENSDSRGYRWNVLFMDDSFVVFDELCKSQCAIEVYPEGANKPILYPVKQEYVPVYHVAEVNITKNGLLLSNNDVFLLTKDGTLKNLGTYYCCELVNSLSSDHKWIVLASTDSKKALVWNLDKDKVEFEYVPLGGMVTSVDYFERGFAITELYSPQTMVYLYSTQKPVKIVGDVAAFVIDILPDDTFLIDDQFDNDARNPGIYRFDPITDKYTLLVAGAHKINYSY